jgi:hypothetical protein
MVKMLKKRPLESKGESSKKSSEKEEIVENIKKV